MVKVEMEFPKDCDECKLYDEGVCLALDIPRYADKSEIYAPKPSWCPIKEDSSIAPCYKDAGIFCGNCDSYIRTSDTFCASCGRKIKWSEKRRYGS